MRFFPFVLIAGCAFAGDDLYFPPAQDVRWEHIEPAKAGYNASLQAVLDFAGSRRSTAVVILYRGRILAEQQWEQPKQKGAGAFDFERSPDGQILEDVASAQKSVASILFGIAQQKGLIHLDDPVVQYLGPNWSKASAEQEKKITMRHLLTMTSGLNAKLEYEAEPGTKWFYNTIAYQKTMRVLARITGKPEDQVSREWLTGPIGMSHSRWVERTWYAGLLGFVSSARDLARLGLFVQAEGQWQGKTILDRAYLRQMVRPSQDLNPSYGYLWWLNGHPAISPGGNARQSRSPARRRPGPQHWERSGGKCTLSRAWA